MYVRILNEKQDRDRHFDCRNAEVCKDDDGRDLHFLNMEFHKGNDISIVLSKGDVIYYMNDNGKTFQIDNRMLDRTKPKVKENKSP